MTNDDVLGTPGPLALRLRAAREARGLTQAQAAAELGVSRPLLIAIEKGTRQANPQASRLCALRSPEVLRRSPRWHLQAYDRAAACGRLKGRGSG